MPDNLLKVHFKLTQNEDGYPPFTSEAIWCTRLDERRFRVDNIPYFATGVSYCDVISVTEDTEGLFDFHEVVEENGHSTLRVIVSDDCADKGPLGIRIRELAARLEREGSLTAVSPPPEILAVDIPPSVSIANIREILSDGEDKGLWSYEESTLAHSS